jgi:hypothetical protein
MCPLTDDGMDYTCEPGTGGVCLDCGFVNRESQEVDVLYLDRHFGTAFVTPDGVGRYYYDDQAQAEDEYGDDFADVLDVDGWDD